MSTAPARAGPIADDYDACETTREHVLIRPDTYVGFAKPKLREEVFLALGPAGPEIIAGWTAVAPALVHIFKEILDNAVDNAMRSRSLGLDPRGIWVTMTRRSVTVKNGGHAIPIEKHKKRPAMYIPEVSFGSMFSGQNLGAYCGEAGKNGVGAKATNIFSRRFAVTVENAEQGLRYSQCWANNMERCDPPEITALPKGVKSSVEVRYEADFARFGLAEPAGDAADTAPELAPDAARFRRLAAPGDDEAPPPEDDAGGYPPTAFLLFARLCADAAFVAKVPVTFNATTFHYPTIQDFARLHLGPAADTSVAYYEWPEGAEVKTGRGGHQAAARGVRPRVELLVADTPDAARVVSFANGVLTREGGVHVDAALGAVLRPIVRLVNDEAAKKAKGEETKRLTIADARPHVSILVSVWVKNPGFGGQTKGRLEGFDDGREHRQLEPGEPPGWPLVFKIPEETLRKVQRWQLVERIRFSLSAKMFDQIKAAGGKKSRFVTTRNGTDANFAGTARSADCCLYVTEGNSAKGYSETAKGLVKAGFNTIGILPMRGKGLNTMKASLELVAKNREIQELTVMLGLSTDFTNPPDYGDERAFATLRYGGLMIMADADVDGKHIVGLLINFFHCFYPSLLRRGFVMYYRTPIVRTTLGKAQQKFFTEAEFEEWKSRTPDAERWSVKYYKGLATSGKAEIADDLEDPKVVVCYYDAAAPDAIVLAFGKGMEDRRKAWLTAWDPREGLELGSEKMKVQPISLFINHEMIHYSIANIERSLPRLEDGLKHSQRQILYAAYKIWKLENEEPKTFEMKVAQFGSDVAKLTNYHHNEEILGKTVIKMAATFTGANNLPPFLGVGQFGTRAGGIGDAGATRYVFVRPHWSLPLLFRREDMPLLDYKSEEGQQIEPRTFYPILPLVLVNGEAGIATGWATKIPNYHVLDLITHVRAAVRGAPPADRPPVYPWWRGFGGTIEVSRRAGGRREVTVLAPRGPTDPPAVSTRVEDDAAPLPDALPLLELRDADGGGADDAADDAAGDAADDAVELVGGSDPLPDAALIVKGVFEVSEELGPGGFPARVLVKELPVGFWNKPYLGWLEKMRLAGHIAGYSDLSTDTVSAFEIEGPKFAPSHRTLRLTRAFHLANMWLLGPNLWPRLYPTIYAVVDDFVASRRALYERRRLHELAELDAKIAELNVKVRFIRAVLDKTLVIKRRPLPDVYADMDACGFPRKLAALPLHSVSQTKIDEMEREALALAERKRALEATSPEDIWLGELAEFEAEYRRRAPAEDDGTAGAAAPAFSAGRKPGRKAAARKAK